MLRFLLTLTLILQITFASFATESIFQISQRGQIRQFESFDGQPLKYRYYDQTASLTPQSTALPAKQHIIYLHGIESHAGWFDQAAIALIQQGFVVHAMDRRGSGLNRQDMGLTAGHIDDMTTFSHDIKSFIEQQEFEQPPIIIGLSWGGKLAIQFDILHPDQASALVLITPGLVSKVDAPWYQKLGIGVSYLFSPTTQFSLPIEPDMFTTTPFYLDYIKTDPLSNKTASAAFLINSVRMDSQIADNIGQVSAPILLFLAGQDRIIDNQAVEALLAKTQSIDFKTVNYPEQTHSIQFDKSKQMVKDITTWVQQLEAPSK